VLTWGYGSGYTEVNSHPERETMNTATATTADFNTIVVAESAARTAAQVVRAQGVYGNTAIYDHVARTFAINGISPQEARHPEVKVAVMAGIQSAGEVA